LQNSNNLNPFSSYKLPYSILDPNPSLINEDGNINDNISLIASITTYRNGTIADGVSKLILVVNSNNPLKFSINGTKPDDLRNGTLSCLKESSNVNNNLSSSINVSSQSISNGKSVVAAVYTPPDSFNQEIGRNRNININVSDLDNPDAITPLEIPIQLYRPPVVLIHGVWTNSYDTWVTVNDFTKKLTDNGFNYIFADYKEYNSETFDPYDKIFGNYGINSTRSAIHDILGQYHCFSIAASQVDIVAHSMGGLMARGFVQQSDYKGKHNFMKGSIHRLITIGTPHLGGHLSKFLYNHREDWYCLDGMPISPARSCKVEPKKLRTIYADNFKTPIDKGAVEALIPESNAYSHLYQTNVKSYAIAGTWRPNANVSHAYQESDYKTITDNSGFHLGKDGFDDSDDDNDLVVSVTSQLGGLPYQIRQSGSDPPNKTALYRNTVHASFMIKDDKEVFSETKSPYIQEDVIRLLNSSDNNKFADAIGKGSACHIPTK
jgi:triacylglycerol esterase/lipase EstA (alpha/beta hydrolase family)